MSPMQSSDPPPVSRRDGSCFATKACGLIAAFILYTHPNSGGAGGGRGGGERQKRGGVKERERGERGWERKRQGVGSEVWREKETRGKRGERGGGTKKEAERGDERERELSLIHI